MKTTTRKRQGFTLVELLVVIAIIATLAGVGVPVLLGKKKEGDKAQAILNAKQVGYALFSFDADYGEFPSKKIETELTAVAGTVLSSASGSNIYLSQVFAGGYIDQEKPFFAKGPMCRQQGDNLLKTSTDLLKAGENGFGYVMKTSAGEALNSSMLTNLPLLVAPNASGTDGKLFDNDTYNKKAIVLSVDMSVSTQTILADKSIKVLDPGAGSAWEAAEVASPEVLAPAKP